MGYPNVKYEFKVSIIEISCFQESDTYIHTLTHAHTQACSNRLLDPKTSNVATYFHFHFSFYFNGRVWYLYCVISKGTRYMKRNTG